MKSHFVGIATEAESSARPHIYVHGKKKWKVILKIEKLVASWQIIKLTTKRVGVKRFKF